MLGLNNGVVEFINESVGMADTQFSSKARKAVIKRVQILAVSINRSFMKKFLICYLLNLDS